MNYQSFVVLIHLISGKSKQEIKYQAYLFFLNSAKNLKVTPNYLLAETLTELEIPNTEQLTELINNATPLQMKLITTMLQSALDALKDT